ncbi:unnamed protein product [Allacma fusca]|uniref:Uncharacterized protein n=1 Tax=Allacma fusca TaxID=39272 RepID=A0A8J2P810_9HEXA|nr:unnamed protein product [Allacma fusca]
MRKAQLLDDEVVKKCYFTKSISQSISFKGRHTKYQWKVFKKDLNRVSKRFVSKLEYQRKTHNRVSSCSSVNVTFKPEIRRSTTITNHGNILRRRLPTFKEVTSFVLRYMKRHKLQPKEIDRITLTASRFKEVQ